MQVILKQNVPSLGRKGEVKNVSDGYYQNFLLPRNLAEAATPGKIKTAEENLKKQLIEKDRIREQAQQIKEKFNGLKITLTGKAKGDKLYGSITEKEILDAVQEKINVRLNKENLHLAEHIKLVGNHELKVRLSDQIEAKFMLEIKAEK